MQRRGVVVTHCHYSTCRCHPLSLLHLSLLPTVTTPLVVVTHCHYSTCRCHPLSLLHLSLSPTVTTPLVVVTHCHYSTCRCHPLSLLHLSLSPTVTTPLVVVTHCHYSTCRCHPLSLLHLSLSPTVTTPLVVVTHCHYSTCRIPDEILITYYVCGQNLSAYIISVTMTTPLCVQAKMCATNSGATARRLDNRGYLELRSQIVSMITMLLVVRYL